MTLASQVANWILQQEDTLAAARGLNDSQRTYLNEAAEGKEPNWVRPAQPTQAIQLLGHFKAKGGTC